jgi:hypothetical protein
MWTFKRLGRNKALLWPKWILAISALLLAGAVYRATAFRLNLLVKNPIMLPVPLKAFPLTINDWVGKDVPILENVQRVAGSDDFLNRLYVNKLNGQWVTVYVAYSARPRTMLGHRPQVCYVAGGWVHDNTEPTQFVSSSGKEVPCLVHHFHRPVPETEEILVLSFYILNGQITTDESVFTGVGWRTPNIAGDPARYVAQVQISSVLENSVREAARDMTDLILGFFPDENNGVRAAEYVSTASSVLK